MKNLQKGSSTVVLLIIVVVILLGAVGYMYYKPAPTNQLQNYSQSTEQVSVNSSSTSKIDKNNEKSVKVTSPVANSSYRVGDTINVEWTPSNYPVIEIALIPVIMEKSDGTNKGVWGGYGGEMEKVSPITLGKYNFVIPKEVPSDTYQIRIISDYNNYEKTSYFSEHFTILNSGK